MGSSHQFLQANQNCLHQIEAHMKYFQCEERFDLDLIFKVTGPANRYEINILIHGTFLFLWVLRALTMHVHRSSIGVPSMKIPGQLDLCKGHSRHYTFPLEMH